MRSCTGAPISWLRLERYALGELDDRERSAIASHLATCEACKACLAEIEGDDRALPPLPAAPPAAPRRGAVVTLRRAAPVAFALAAAAAVVLLAGRIPKTESPERTKGGDVAFALVGEDDALVAEAGGRYRDGERMKAVVTCPPEMRASFELVVYDRGEASFPLPPFEGLACGNAVPLPGAFRLTGREPMRVCLVWNDEGAVDRDALRRGPPRETEHAMCKDLVPAP